MPNEYERTDEVCQTKILENEKTETTNRGVDGCPPLERGAMDSPRYGRRSEV